jgi:hypothetical protein
MKLKLFDALAASASSEVDGQSIRFTPPLILFKCGRPEPVDSTLANMVVIARNRWPLS